MNKITNPERKEWLKLIPRPAKDAGALNEQVIAIFEEIRKDGDSAVQKYSRLFDKVESDSLQVSEQSIASASSQVSDDLKKAIQLAKGNIEVFHTSQKDQVRIVETMEGVQCWRESRAIDCIGLYIPGGTAPLFSTVLMLGIPAQIAGCKEIILCTPPGKNGEIHPAILYTASLVGITKIFRVGGIQAIGAMTFGTQSIPKADKIFGPGNAYVTAAKQMAQFYGVAIDMPAGPSEVLIIADQNCNPSFIAADLLSQAEHGTDSQVILLSDKEQVIDSVMVELAEQLEALPRKEIALGALQNSNAIVLKTINECLDFSNLYAPEHLILATEQAKEILAGISNAGSVFIGNYSCESAGDYATGTNHTLPTNGYARSYSGVSLDSFVKKITFQELTKEGIRNLGPAIELMAEAEHLFAHKNAVTLRLKD